LAQTVTPSEAMVYDLAALRLNNKRQFGWHGDEGKR
jgi:hypothetical protein